MGGKTSTANPIPEKDDDEVINNVSVPKVKEVQNIFSEKEKECTELAVCVKE